VLNLVLDVLNNGGDLRQINYTPIVLILKIKVPNMLVKRLMTNKLVQSVRENC